MVGHGSTCTDPWPTWPIQKSDPFDPLTHDPSTHCLLWWRPWQWTNGDTEGRIIKPLLGWRTPYYQNKLLYLLYADIVTKYLYTELHLIHINRQRLPIYSPQQCLHINYVLLIPAVGVMCEWSYVWFLSAIRSADYCNDLERFFANKSRILGWIWMKLGRWSWGPKRLSLARFQRNRAMGFGESAKKWVAEALFFCDVNHAPLLPLSLDRFPLNFPRTRVQWRLATSGFIFQKGYHYGVEFLEKSSFSGYLRVPCLCSAYGSRETFCDA